MTGQLFNLLYKYTEDPLQKQEKKNREDMLILPLTGETAVL